MSEHPRQPTRPAITSAWAISLGTGAGAFGHHDDGHRSGASARYVYRGGVRIGATTISSGKPGYETPTGVVTILQKDKDHYSKKYHHAPMPYDLRLTWEGISVHGGHLPGYPASHGCVRLPIAFSRALFNQASLGMTVTITDREAGEGLVAAQTALRPQLAENGRSLLSPEILSAGGYQSGPPPVSATPSAGP